MGTVETDARDRAARTFVQGLAVDITAALVILLLPIVTSANAWGDFEWALLGFLVAKTVAVTALSYLMRVWIEPYRAIRRSDSGHVDLAVALLLGIAAVLVLVLTGRV